MEKLFQKLGITPKNLKLYKMAFSHSSYVNEHKLKSDYERLEFLGDKVLDLVISDYLYKLSNKVQKIESNNLEEIAMTCNTSLENVLIIKTHDIYTIEKLDDYNDIPSKDLKLPIGLTKLEEKIYKMRVLYHYSQKEIAKSLLISQSSVSKKLKIIGEKLINK